MALQIPILAQAANQARGISIDAVHKAGIGHLGLPLGCAEIGAVLYGHALVQNPDAPRWINRDRFVLSAGHGSMFLYAWLHLSGFDIPIEQIAKFRTLHINTPEHAIFDYHVVCLAGDGCMQEGVGMEAVAFAGHQKLDNLILLYDSNL